MRQRIDLSQAPSSMERRAQAWSKNTCKPAPTPKPAYKPQVFAPSRSPDLHQAPFPSPKRQFNTKTLERSRRPDIELDDGEFRAIREWALKSIARNIPDPRKYAAKLPYAEAQALTRALRTRTMDYRLHEADKGLARALQTFGLLHMGEELTLTIFAKQVRKVLLEELF